MSSLRYSPDGPLTLSSLGSEKRIPHLETNAYIYQSSSLGLSPSLASDRYSRPLVSPKFSHESLKEAIDRRIVDRELQFEGGRRDAEGTLQGRMQTLDMEIEQHLEHSRVREIEERVQRRQAAESRDRIRTIEQTIDERSRAESLKSLHSPARRVAVVPLDESLYASESRKRSKSAKRPRSGNKYEFLNDRYSKFNTKSPYAKSTFSHDVRSMENKAYTYLRHSAEGRSRGSSKTKQRTGTEELEFLRKVLMLAEAHAKRCPDLRIELNRLPDRKYEPRPPYSPLEDPLQSREAKEDTPLFERRRPRKDERPNSAKVDSKPGRSSKPRPVSANKRSPVLLANIGRQRVYAPHKDAKARLRPIPWDRERLYEEHQALKVSNNALRDENLRLKTRVNQLEKEVMRYSELLEAQSGEKFHQHNSHLVAGLKQSVKDMKTEMKLRDDEIVELKKNIRTTRTAELEVELQAYIDECTRLRHHLEEVIARQNQMMQFETPMERQGGNSDTAFVTLQTDHANALSQLEQVLQELEQWKERYKELEKKAGKPKKTPDKHLKADLAKLKAEVERAEKQKAEVTAAFETDKARLMSEVAARDEHIRKLQGKVSETEAANSSLTKQSQEQQIELKSVRGQLTEIQREVVTISKRSQGFEPVKVSKPGRVFEKIHRYINQKNILLSVFFSLLDRQNKGVLDAKDLQAGLKKYGIAARNEQIEEAVLIASGGKTVVSLTQLESQYERYDFSEVYESSSEEEERKPKPEGRPSDVRPESRAAEPKHPMNKAEQRTPEPKSDAKPVDPKPLETKPELKPGPEPTAQNKPVSEEGKQPPVKRPASPVPVRPSTPQDVAKPPPAHRGKVSESHSSKEKRPEDEQGTGRETPVKVAQSGGTPRIEDPTKNKQEEDKKTDESKQPTKPKLEAQRKPSYQPPSDATPVKESPQPLPGELPQKLKPDPAAYRSVQQSEVADLLRHISFRLQIHRITKDKIPMLLFGDSYDEHRDVTLFELQELLSQPPINLTDPSQAELLSKFLLESDDAAVLRQLSADTNVSSQVDTMLSKLDRVLPDWHIFSPENEEQYDYEIAYILSEHFADLQAACEEVDPEKKEYVSMSQFKSVLKALGIAFKATHMKYLELLFYSHDFELDRVPYYNFLKAYSGEKEDEEYSEEQFEGEEEYDEEDDDKGELVRAYLGELARALYKSRKTVRNAFAISENERVYPPEFVFGARALGLPDLRKEDLIVILESLQDEEAEELCVSLPYLEEVLQHYGVPDDYQDVQEAESSE